MITVGRANRQYLADLTDKLKTRASSVRSKSDDVILVFGVHCVNVNNCREYKRHAYLRCRALQKTFTVKRSNNVQTPKVERLPLVSQYLGC